jgi:hypothetical protein
VQFFSYAVQGGLVLLIAVPILRNDFGYGPGAWSVSFVTTGALCAINILLLGEVLRPEKPWWNVALRLHLLLLLLTPAVAFVPALSGPIGFVLAATFFPPLLLFHTRRSDSASVRRTLVQASKGSRPSCGTRESST